MALPNSFRSLRQPNYRRYFAGQVLSLAGTWAQNIGMGWLVLDLSGDSGLALGIVTALQFVPVLLFGLWAGLLADRYDKRRFIVATQVALAATAGLLALLTMAGLIELWMVYVLAFMFGVATAADTPARLSFVVEMVGPTDLPNALALNSAVVNAGRIIGPGIAAAIIVLSGGDTGPCFLVNAVSYVGTILAVMSMRGTDLEQPVPVARARGQVRQGLRYAWQTPLLRYDLLLIATTSLLAFNFPVILPLLAKETFDGGADVYSLMTAAMGLGAFISALVLAGMGRPFGPRLVFAVGLLASSLLVVSVAPTLVVVVALLPILGAGQIVSASSANAMVQLDAAPAMRGRVTAIFSLATGGATPFGGILLGAVVEGYGPRRALAVSGLGALAAVLAFGGPLLRDRRGRTGEPDVPSPVASPLRS